MKVKMMFGTIASALLAYGVLRLVGAFSGTVGVFDIAAEVLLTSVYLAAFRAAAVGKSKAPAVTSRERIMVWEEEAEIVPAAA